MPKCTTPLPTAKPKGTAPSVAVPCRSFPTPSQAALTEPADLLRWAHDRSLGPPLQHGFPALHGRLVSGLPAGGLGLWCLILL